MQGSAFEAVIGLEIHAQLRTVSKIFCGCSTAFGAAPNTHICPVCIGLPGALPVLNRAAVDFAICAGLALGCEVQPRSVFARKNYFYPDLPKGYQISQYELPIATGGVMVFAAGGEERRVGITRVHMEEDAGKSIHDGFADTDRKSYVDYNRSGVPLIEIVSEPDLRSAPDAAEFFTRLRAILVWLGVNDGNMEEGSLRCDANVSVRPRGQTALGTKAEVKNLNSFRFLQRALEHEIARQIEVLTEGGRVVQETRLWDAAAGRTVSMRSKEAAHDYRYFPEPDLPAVVIDADRVERIRAGMPELPEARRRRLVDAYGLSEYDAGMFVDVSRGTGDYFEQGVKAGASPKPLANVIMSSVRTKMNELGTDDIAVVEARVPAAELAKLVILIETGAISATTAKEVFGKMYASNQTAAAIVAADGLAQIDDEAQIVALIVEVLAANAGPVSDYRGGKASAFGFLVGKVMKAAAGKANPKRVNELLKRALEA